MALFDSMNQNSRMAETLGEPAHITERREYITTRLNLMKQSMKVLQRDPDIINSGGDEVERQMRAAGPPRPGPGGPVNPQQQQRMGGPPN